MIRAANCGSDIHRPSESASNAARPCFDALTDSAPLASPCAGARAGPAAEEEDAAMLAMVEAPTGRARIGMVQLELQQLIEGRWGMHYCRPCAGARDADCQL